MVAMCDRFATFIELQLDQLRLWFGIGLGWGSELGLGIELVFGWALVLVWPAEWETEWIAVWLVDLETQRCKLLLEYLNVVISMNMSRFYFPQWWSVFPLRKIFKESLMHGPWNLCINKKTVRVNDLTPVLSVLESHCTPSNTNKKS